MRRSTPWVAAASRLTALRSRLLEEGPPGHPAGRAGRAAKARPLSRPGKGRRAGITLTGAFVGWLRKARSACLETRREVLEVVVRIVV
jgi:hypothetical protein